MKVSLKEGASEVHTFSDVVAAIESVFPDETSVSALGSGLLSEPVGRPRSCRTCQTTRA